MNEREAMAILVSAQAISYGKRERALGEAQSALALLADPHAYVYVLGIEGVSAIREAMRKSDRLLEYLHETGTHLIVRGEADYPRLLAQTRHAPHLLFCLGSAKLDDALSLAIVGTRRPGAYGMRHTRELSRELASAGMTIVSGMAAGVDAAAHWGALDAGGRTVAVLGCALDKPYPAENRTLMRRIIESGGSVISEYPPGVAPTRYSFVQRNRIVAGMALGVLVTDAPLKSGARHTVQFALDEGREVFALPGDIDRPGSQLPNRLIAEGARVTTCAGDILSELVIEPGEREDKRAAPKPRREAPKAEQTTLPMPPPMRALDAQEQAVCGALREGELDFDALSDRTGISSDELGGVLMMLELDGIVESLPGLSYRLA